MLNEGAIWGKDGDYLFRSRRDVLNWSDSRHFDSLNQRVLGVCKQFALLDDKFNNYY